MSKILIFSNNFTGDCIDGYSYGLIILSSEQREILRKIVEATKTIIENAANVPGLKPETINFDCTNSFKPFYFDLGEIQDLIDEELYHKIAKTEGSFWIDGVLPIKSEKNSSLFDTISQAFCSQLIVDGCNFMWRACNDSDPEYAEGAWCRLDD